jgi:hypothetical protein
VREPLRRFAADVSSSKTALKDGVNETGQGTLDSQQSKIWYLPLTAKWERPQRRESEPDCGYRDSEILPTI